MRTPHKETEAARGVDVVCWQTNHFWPWAGAEGKHALFPGGWKDKVLGSDVGIVAVLGVLGYWAYSVGSAWPVLALYGAPYLVRPYSACHTCKQTTTCVCSGHARSLFPSKAHLHLDHTPALTRKHPPSGSGRSTRIVRRFRL